MNKYKLAENVEHFATTEYFIDTPDGRMSIRMPQPPISAEAKRRLKAIVDALNVAERVAEIR